MPPRSTQVAHERERDADKRRVEAPTKGNESAGALPVFGANGEIGPLNSGSVTALQRGAGNRAVQTLLSARTPTVQRGPYTTTDVEPFDGVAPGAPSAAPSPMMDAVAEDGGGGDGGGAPGGGDGPAHVPGQVMDDDAPPPPPPPAGPVAGPVVAPPPAGPADAGVATGANSLDNDERLGSGGGVGGEVAKPVIAGTGAAVGYGVGHGMANAASALSGTTNAGGLGGAAFGGLAMMDQGLGVYRGARRWHRDSGKDRAGAQLGKRKVRAQGIGVAAGIAGTVGAAYKLRASMGTMGTSAAGVAAGAAGIVAGGLVVGQGVHRAYKALRRRSATGSLGMTSARGLEWQTFIKSKQGQKGAVGVAKAATGALGVAAGGLLVAGMAPAAFAVGIAAMAAGGIMALWKMGGKINKARKAKKATEDFKNDPANHAELAEASKPNNHDKAKKVGDKIHKAYSAGAVKAGEMRDAYLAGEAQLDAAARATLAAGGPAAAALPVGVREAFDVERLMGIIGVDPELLKSQSGQELIQKKLSLNEAL